MNCNLFRIPLISVDAQLLIALYISNLCTIHPVSESFITLISIEFIDKVAREKLFLKTNLRSVLVYAYN